MPRARKLLRARQLVRWLPALAGILGAAGVSVLGLWRLRGRDGGAGLVFLALAISAYGLHWYPGHWAYPGPIYAFEALGIAVVALLVVLDDAPVGWSRSLPFVALIAGAAFFITRFPSIADQAALRAAPRAAAAAAGLPDDAVVLLPYFDPSQPDRVENRYTPSLRPVANEIVYVRKLARRGPTRAALSELGLADRPVYRFVPDASGRGGALVPFE